MTSLAAAEPDVLTFESTVERVDDSALVLDETYFYPEGGGQPADRGALAGTAVRDVQQRDGEVVHELAADPAVSVGETVEGAIDPDFRRYCVRAHTASHVLYGAGRRLLEDLGYGGFDISDSKVRVDFATSTEIDDETLVQFERLVNRTVWDSRDVSWETVPREDALAREDVAFNQKTEEGVAGETVRLVTVDGWDVAACGGTHVTNTREIGPVAVLDRSNPGEGLTRVEFAVGPEAITRWTTMHEQTRAAARALDTRFDELPDAVARLQDERDELEDEASELREQVVDARLADLAASVETRDGNEWLVGDVPNLDANELADRAQSLAGSTADVVVLVDPEAEYMAAASECAVDAGDLVDRATDSFGGGGGGSPSVAQAGGLDASVADVIALFE